MSADVDTIREALDYLGGKAETRDISVAGDVMLALAALGRLAAAEAQRDTLAARVVKVERAQQVFSFSDEEWDQIRALAAVAPTEAKP